MVRVVFTTYLMFMTLAGPWLCCCKTVPTAAPCSCADSSCAQRQTSTHSGCCGEHKHGESDRHAPSEAPGIPRTPPCPCQDDPTRTAVVSPTSDMSEQLQRGTLSQELTGFACPLFAERTQAVDVASALGDRQPLPFVSGQDLLHLLHILRC